MIEKMGQFRPCVLYMNLIDCFNSKTLRNTHRIIRRYRGSKTCSGQGMLGKLMVQTNTGIVTCKEKIEKWNENSEGSKTHPSSAILHGAATSDVDHLVLEHFLPLCELVRQQSTDASFQELVDAHLRRVVRLEAGLAQRAFPLVVQAAIYARPEHWV